jgi:SAM-dependent methyltransferase
MSKGLFDASANWYEAALPLAERRRRGHFSTPLALVERILDACGYTLDHDLAPVRVLDPACGSGNFLLGAAQRLLASSQHTAYTPRELATLAQRNLWGLDPDPISCFLAETRLRLIAKTALARVRLPRVHIHQSDALALPWEPCVDLFLANPPYLAAKNTDLTGYQSTHQRGQSDSYLLFLNLGMRVVRPGGWLGLVLPDPFLARANAVHERFNLLRDFTIHQLWHLSGVFPAQVGAVVIIAQKQPPPASHRVTWMRDKWKHTSEPAPATNVAAQFIAPDKIEDKGAIHCAVTSSVPTSTIPQAQFLQQPRAELRYLLHEECNPLITRLHRALEGPGENSQRRLVPLGDFVTISRGEELGRASREIRLDDPYSRSDELLDHPNWQPVLLGGVDVRSYRAPTANAWIAREHVRKQLARYLAPKLLVVKSTDRLQAALDTQGHIALQTLYLLHLKNPIGADLSRPSADFDDLYYFLSLLNSRLLREYVYVLHTAYKWVQPQIEQHVLARLPVPVAAPVEKQEIIERAKHLMLACSEARAVVEWDEAIQHLYDKQEQAISALYEAALI